MNAMLGIASLFDKIARRVGLGFGWIIVPLILIIMFDVVTRKLDYTRLLFSEFTQAVGYSVSTILQDLEWHFHGVLLLMSFGVGYLANAHVRVDVFSIGFGNPGGDALVVGDLDAQYGQIYGDGWYEGTASLTNGKFIGGSLSQGTPIDFEAADWSLTGLSLYLAGLTANADTTLYTYPGATLAFLSGSDPFFNVFDLDATQLADLRYLAVWSPAGSTNVINVSGESFDISASGVRLIEIGASDVIWNAYEATSVDLSSIGFKGSLLAPGAHVNLDNGHLLGTVVAASAGGSGQWNHALFEGEIPCPE